MIGKNLSFCFRLRQPQFSRLMSELPTKKGGLNWGGIHSHGPIMPISLEDFEIDQKQFLKDHQPIFHKLEADPYDIKKDQLEFLENRFPESISLVKEDYFIGKLTFEQALKPLYDQLSSEEKREFNSFSPYRYRAIARFVVSFNSGRISVKRIPTNHFVQTHALVFEENKTDVRKFTRKFHELNECYSNFSTFRSLLVGVGRRIRQVNPKASGFDITAHWVKVITRKSLIRGNSPEGIHQDGYPWLMTALVVERKNVEEGESQIFGPDKQTKIFSMTLREGQGILQPDLGTDLWHTVTKVRPKNGHEEGYRSIIGLDIAVIEEGK